MNITASILLRTALFAAALSTGLAAERQALLELVHRNARAELDVSIREADPASVVADDFIANARAAASCSHEDVRQSLAKQLSDGLEATAMVARVGTSPPGARRRG
jgi:hypothetical protein